MTSAFDKDLRERIEKFQKELDNAFNQKEKEKTNEMKQKAIKLQAEKNEYKQFVHDLLLYLKQGIKEIENHINSSVSPIQDSTHEEFNDDDDDDEWDDDNGNICEYKGCSNNADLLIFSKKRKKAMACCSSHQLDIRDELGSSHSIECPHCSCIIPTKK